MTPLMTTMAITLGVAVPLLMAYALMKGIGAAPLSASSKTRSRNRLLLTTALWTIAVWALALANVFDYRPGDVIPRFAIALVVPVILGLLLFRSKSFTTILDHAPLSLMVGMQTFRLLGVLFLFVASAGLGPADLKSAGYGDLATGTLALVAGLMLYNGVRGAKEAAWLFTAAGLFDLLNVSRILLGNYPIWSDADPSSAVAAEFPLVLILGLVAPIALLFHIYAIRGLLRPGTGTSEVVEQEMEAPA